MPCVVLAVVVTALVGVAQAHAVRQGRREGRVGRPAEDDRSLRTKPHPPEGEPDPLPVEAALPRLDYDLKVVGDAAVGEARLTVDVLKEGWVRVWVPGGLRVRDA